MLVSLGVFFFIFVGGGGGGGGGGCCSGQGGRVDRSSVHSPPPELSVSCCRVMI